MNQYKFYKTETEWYVDLPEYIAGGGNMDDLQMVEGADTMLDIIAAGKNEVVLNISTEPFEDGDELTLIEKCHPLKGGGYYLMKSFEGEETNLRMWLCSVVEFVFNEIPEKIFVKKLNTNQL